MALTNKERHRKAAEGILSGLRSGRSPLLADIDGRMSVVGPFNPITRTRYRGINALLLGTTEAVLDTGDPRFLTRSQIERHGGALRADDGRKPEAHPVYFVKPCFVDDVNDRFIDPGQTARLEVRRERQESEELGQPMTAAEFGARLSDVEREVVEECRSGGFRQVFMLAEFSVYHASDVTGLADYAAPDAPDGGEIVEAIMRNGALRFHTGDEPDAKPGTVTLPSQDAFADARDFYSEVLRRIAAYQASGKGEVDMKGGDVESEISGAIAYHILASQYGLPYHGARFADLAMDWAAEIDRNPKRLMFAANGAEKIVHTVSALAPEAFLSAQDELAVRRAEIDAGGFDFDLDIDGDGRTVEVHEVDLGADNAASKEAVKVQRVVRQDFSVIAAGR